MYLLPLCVFEEKQYSLNPPIPGSGAESHTDSMPIELLLFGLIFTESLALLFRIWLINCEKLTLPGTLGRANMYT